MSNDPLFNKMVEKVFKTGRVLPAEANTLTLENMINILQSDDPEIPNCPLTLGAIIQGLYEFYDPEHYCIADDTCENCRLKGQYRRGTFKTMEQFMLAFVMQERFNQTWDKNTEEWVQVKP